MKNRLLYLLPFVLVFASGCVGSKNNLPTPNNVPLGVFTGKFTRYHLHAQTGVKDSASANLVVDLEETGYTVTGDTATLHAGSFGGFAVNSQISEMEFVDKTFPATGTPTKVHLSGIYTFTYDGSLLKMRAFGPLDTLTFFYSLKKN